MKIGQGSSLGKTVRIFEEHNSNPSISKLAVSAGRNPLLSNMFENMQLLLSFPAT